MDKTEGYYQPKYIDRAQVVACDAIHAQEFCKFIVFILEKLPALVICKEQKLRKEAADNTRSTFRQVFEGFSRTLVIKQYLLLFSDEV